MTAQNDSTVGVQTAGKAQALGAVALGFQDLADRADQLRAQCRELGMPYTVVERLDRMVFSAEVGAQNAREALAAMPAHEKGAEG